jgi:V8-like Glu-specific endopeptidase
MLIIAAAISVGIGLATSAPAGALARHETGGTPAVTYVVSDAAQASARAFWTPARMSAATPDITRPVAVLPEVSAPSGTPTAVRFSGVPTTGALFYTTGTRQHFCTASVVDSPVGDLVITAAHCVYGSRYATNIAYVPKYHDGTRPYGTWTVSAITVAAGWRDARNPNLDVAFLAVRSPSGTRIQSVTGGLTFAINAPYAMAIAVIGYNNPDAAPVGCATHSFKFQAGAQIEFYCHGYWDGTSGGPWISGYNPHTGTGVVHGVIGGYEEGGAYEWASYSVHFGAAIGALFSQAQSH